MFCHEGILNADVGPQKYKQLKDQGTPENDPELLKCQHILTAFQKHQRFQQQKQAFLQQQAQRNQQNQQHSDTNGVNGTHQLLIPGSHANS